MDANKNLSITCKKALNFITQHSLSGEEWQPLAVIDGQEDYYYISSKGRVLSVYHQKAIVLKPQLTGSHYYYVKIHGKNQRIHHLVAAAFLTLPGAGKYEIHHIDRNPLNNAAENLIYLTKEEHKQIHREINAATAAALRPRESSSQEKTL